MSKFTLNPNVIILMLFVLFIDISFAQSSKSSFSFTPYVKLNSFGWKEFDDNGAEALSESGFLFGFGSNAEYAFTKKKNIFIIGDFQMYFGKVDYDGFLFDQQTGQRTPYSNKTGYFGLEFSAISGYKIKTSKEFLLIPIAGLGKEYWTRDLDDGGQYGYDEDYTSILFNLGIFGDYLVDKNVTLFSKFMLKIPLSLSEYVDATSRGNASPADVNLNPGKNPRIYFETGVNFSQVLIVGYFETWTLSKSEPDKNFLQPESVRTWFGLKVGYEFKL